MEDWVDRAHAAGQTEGEQVSSCLSNNFKRSEVLFREFLRGSSGANMVRLTNTLSPMMKSRDGVRHLLAEAEYRV